MGRKKREPSNPVIFPSPENIRRRLKSVQFNSVDSTLAESIQELLCSPSSLSQISILKQMCNDLQINELSGQCRDLALEVIVELYLLADTGNPVKRPVFSILEANAQHPTTVTIMSVALCKSFSKDLPFSGWASRVVENVVLHFSSELGTRVIKHCFVQCLGFLKQLLKEGIHIATSCRDTRVVGDTYQWMSKVVKALGLTLQLYQSDGLICFHNVVEEGIEELLPLFVDILCSDSSMLTCKLNVGMVFPVLLRVKDPEQFTKMVCQWPDMWLPGSPMAEVCFLNGLVGSLSSEELLSNDENHGTVLAVYILQRILLIHTRSKEPSFLLTCAKTTVQWTNRIIDILKTECSSETCAASLCSNGMVTESLLQFVWSYWEHYIDAISEQAQEVFSNALEINSIVLKGEKKDAFLKELATFLLGLPWHRKGKYAALGRLAQEYGCSALLKLKPELVKGLLLAAEEPAMCCYVKDLTQRLSTLHKREASSDDFQQTWLVPFLSVVRGCPRPLLVSLFQHVLPVLVAVGSGTMQVMFEKMAECGDDLVPATLKCLLSDKMYLQAGMLQMWSDALLQGICHRDDQVRLDALSLLVDHPKSCEPVQPDRLSLLKRFVHLNIAVQSAAFRQQMVASFKKLLNRIYDSSSFLRKLSVKSGVRNDAGTFLSAHQDFVSWLRKYCLKQLYPGANFGRRSTSLELLQLLACIQAAKGENCRMTLDWSPEECATLLQCLKDPYEANKMAVLHLLRSVPARALGFEDQDRIRDLFTATLELTSSIRPPDSVTAAYLLELLVDVEGASTVIARLLSEKDSERTTVVIEAEQTASVYLCLHSLASELKLQLEVAKGDLLKAASSGPIYGALMCVRALLSVVPWRTLPSSQIGLWKAMLDDVINLGFQVAEVVRPIVTNASPEGQLDLQGNSEVMKQVQEALKKGLGRKFRLSSESIEEGTLADLAEVDITKALAVAAQMLLLCGWRAHREVSLLFGDLSEFCPMSPASCEKSLMLLSVDQVLKIGDFFMEEMSTIRHRGAFEQAYTAFVKLCHVLWRCSHPELVALPTSWLSDLMIAVKQRGLSATRRSAGIPFIVQALLVSEPTMLGSKAFHRAMKEFLEVARPDSDSAVESKVHAINVLRALYRNAKLGDMVVPYVADGVKVALLGFKASSWALRNSATLLFSALMTRIFGVNRSQDEQQKKNCLTGHIFFLRFPSLFSFLLEQLGGVEDTDHHWRAGSNTYPILLMLARLYPSVVEGSFRLVDFVPHVMRCVRSPIWKVRALAARALVPLLASLERQDFVRGCIASLPDISQYHTSSNNVVHGTLMQVEQILKSDAECLADRGFVDALCADLRKKLWLATSKNPCLVTRAAYLNIVLTCVSNSSSATNMSSLLTNEVVAVLRGDTSELFKKQAQYSIPVGREAYETAVCSILLHLGCSCLESSFSKKDLTDFLEKAIRHGSHETVWTALQFVHQSLLLWSLDANEKISRRCTLFAVEGTRTQVFETVFRVLEYAVEKKLLGNPACVVEACSVLSLCRDFSILVLDGYPNLGSVLEFLLSMVKSSTHEIVSCALLGLSTHIAEQIICRQQTDGQASATCNSASLLRWTEELYNSSKPNGDFSRRLAASRAILMLARVVGGQEDTCKLSTPFWKSLINFLQDDDLPIRDNAVATVHYLVSALGFPDLPLSTFSDHTPLDVGVEVFVRLMPPAEAVQTILDWMLASQALPLDGESDEQPFEKGELNTYAEEVTLVDLCFVHLCALAPRLPDSVKFTVEPVTESGQLLLGLADLVKYCIEQCLRLASVVFSSNTNATLNRHADLPLIKLYQHASVAAAFANRTKIDITREDVTALDRLITVSYPTEFTAAIVSRLQPLNQRHSLDLRQ